MKKYVLDACALIAYFDDELGANVVEGVLNEVVCGGVVIYMNKINWLEVYYDAIKVFGKQKADRDMETVRDMPIEIINGIDDDVFERAGILKSKYKISLADSVALAESMKRGAFLVTSDHHEFEAVGRGENVKIEWFR